MSSHVYIEDIAKHEGQPVTIKGWLHNRRSSGKIHFLTVRDGSGFIQAVMSKAAVGDEMFRTADHLGQETSLIVHGQARADARSKTGYEIDVTSLEVVGASHLAGVDQLGQVAIVPAVVFWLRRHRLHRSSIGSCARRLQSLRGSCELSAGVPLMGRGASATF